MAMPIKETPVLTGKDAARFEQIMKKNSEKKVPRADFDRAKAVFKNVKLV